MKDSRKTFLMTYLGVRDWRSSAKAIGFCCDSAKRGDERWGKRAGDESAYNRSRKSVATVVAVVVVAAAAATAALMVTVVAAASETSVVFRTKFVIDSPTTLMPVVLFAHNFYSQHYSP